MDTEKQQTEGGVENAAKANGIRVFVYGTLKKGQPNHYLLQDADFLGECVLSGGYRMVNLGWYPGVVRQTKDGQDVQGEVYRVDQPTFHSLDALEGHPTFYSRVKVPTPWKNAWIYTLPEAYLDGRYPDVEGGQWNGREAEA